MKKTEFIDDFADLHEDEEILRIDGFDEACVGWTGSWSGNERPIRLVYDENKIIEILMEQGMDSEEAIEYYDFNIAGAYLGSNTPLIMSHWHDYVALQDQTT